MPCSPSHTTRTWLVGLALTLVLSIGVSTTVDAQDAGTAPAADSNNWAYQCAQAQEGQAPACRVVQNIVLQQTNQRLLTVVIEPREGAPNHALVLALPHGVFLPTGAQVRVDDGEPVSLVIQTSDANGAYAGTAISDALLDSLKKGTQMVVAFKTAQREDLAVPVTLIGFTAAYTKLGG